MYREQKINIFKYHHSMKNTLNWCILVLFMILFCQCKKEEKTGRQDPFNFGEISTAQKELQDEFELIINDLDAYGLNGNSIDSMKITKLICGENDTCDSIAFPKLNGGTMNLKLQDLVILSNGGMRLLSLNIGSETEEIFLENLDGHPEAFPYLELIEMENGIGSIYYGTIIGLNPVERTIEMSLWNGLLDERLRLSLELK